MSDERPEWQRMGVIVPSSQHNRRGGFRTYYMMFAERELTDRAFDLLFLFCTNFRAVEARPLLQLRLGVPVVTSNQATIDATFAAIGATANWPVSALA